MKCTVLNVGADNIGSLEVFSTANKFNKKNEVQKIKKNLPINKYRFQTK